MIDNRKEPMVSIVIPSHNNRRRDLVDNISSIVKGKYKNWTITVIDQANTDDTYSHIRKRFPKIKVIRNSKNSGATGGKNQGIRLLPRGADYILFLDSDFVAETNAISELVLSINNKPEYGGATAKILYYHSPNIVQYAGSSVGLITGINWSNSGPDDGRFDKLIPTEGAGGAVLVKREVVKKVGFFDEAFFPVYYEDADYCYRMGKAGYKILYVPTSRFYHKAPFQNTEAWLNNAYLTARNKLIFMKKLSVFFIFFLVIYPIFPLFYLLISLKYRRYDALREYMRGIIDGFGYIIRN